MFKPKLGAAMRLLGTASLVCAAMAGAGVAQDVPGRLTIPDFTPVTDEMLRNPRPEDWLQMRGNYEAWGYSPLDQINTDNVGGLQLAWARIMAPGDRAEGFPLVYDGIMFLPNAWSTVQAIDAATGDLIWEYFGGGPQPEVDPIGQVNRGIFLYDDKVLLADHNNHIIALDARTGQVIWDVDRGDYGQVVTSTGPIVVDGVVITGSSCQRAPFGCYVTGHDVETGEELWRNEVIPRPGEPGDETWGGVPYENRWCTGVWGQITYDPELDLVHYGSSGICPASEFQRNQVGAEITLFGTNTRFAVRPDSGEIVWSHQVLPNDNWDQECTYEMMLIDTVVNPNPDTDGMLAVGNVSGENRRTLTGMPCKNPVFWSFDAETGEFLYAKETWSGAQNIYESIDTAGTVTLNRETVLDEPDSEINFCTSFSGGRNWHSGGYNPDRNLLLQSTSDICTVGLYARMDREPAPQFTYNTGTRGSVVNPLKGNDLVGRLDAVDVATGETLWSWETRPRAYAPVLSTGGDLVFNAALDRYFRAHDLATGELLWQTRLGSAGISGMASYSVDGRQYIAVVAGTGVITVGQNTPEIDGANGGEMVYVFALPE